MAEEFNVCSLCMKVQANTFLGTSGFARSIDDCTLALTTYAGNLEYEEWHAHERSSISFLLHGTYEEDLCQRQYKRRAGDIKFIPAGVQHRCHSYEAAKKINLEFSSMLLQTLQVTEAQLHKVLPASLHTRFILVKLYKELSDEGHYTEASAQLLLYRLFGGTADNVVYKEPPAWVKVLRELLHDEWESNFDLHQLAGIAGVHPVTISRYFPQYFSSTLGAYVRAIKTDKALGMMHTTSLSLTEIAYACGFADQAHFTRTFKEVTGFLPKDFRKL